ncbi:MAG: hypothetical protein GW892_25325 [Armatimonadetes bacterium]|nr:hypothetical protein [Armatimonadota bacterium]
MLSRLAPRHGLPRAALVLSVVAVAGACRAPASPAAVEAAKQEPQVERLQSLGKPAYHATHRQLALCVQQAPIPADPRWMFALPKEWLRPVGLDENPPFGNLIFQLVDSRREDPLSGDVIWVAYELWRTGGGPPERWTGGIVWDARAEEAYIVLMQSRGQYSYNILRVYRARPGQAIAKHPISLEAGRPQAWPKTAMPFAQVRTRGRADALTLVGLRRRGDELVITSESEGKAPSPAEFRYHLKTGKWSTPLPIEHIGP